MNWQQWVLIIVQVLGALCTIALIGKPREPISPGNAVFTVIFSAVFVALVVSL